MSAQSGPVAPSPPRNAPGLLLDHAFGPFIAGKLLSTIGMWVHNITSSVVMYRLTGSALMVGLVSVAQFTPQMLLTPWSGALADRSERRRQVMLGRGIAGAGSGALAIWLAAAGDSGESTPWIIIGAAGVVGIGVATAGPAMHALLPSLVQPSELAGAVTLNAMPPAIGRSVGPAIGAVLLTTFGSVAAFGLSAFTHVLFVGALLLVPPWTSKVHDDAGRSITAGVRFVRADSTSAVILLGVFTIGMVVDPVVTLTPSLADRLGSASSFVGWLASMFGASAASAYLIVGFLRQRLGLARLAVLGLVLLGTGMGTTGFSSSEGMAIAGFGMSGIGFTFAVTSFTTLLQMRIPDNLRGRVMALWAICFLGSRPLAASVNGGVTDAFSVAHALLLVALFALSGAMVTWGFRRRFESVTGVGGSADAS